MYIWIFIFDTDQAQFYSVPTVLGMARLPCLGYCIHTLEDIRSFLTPTQ
jgi:hypothetical protein